jgi:7,8-dihydro-6-hydroxymethylpterin dimethyltransferase
MAYMTPEAIAQYSPDRLPSSNAEAREHVTRTLARLNLAGPNQQSGQRWAIGCVALEITQRCNLDCTLCYLSENSEAVQDLPIEEIFRRIDLIHAHFGPNTDVQITGGEPTLRKREELLAIVDKVRSLGLRPTLMTNGLRATRSLLRQLANAGLMDVAFHVDTTQQIKGFRTELELNALRRKFIDRASGLGLSIMFNTTVHDNNFDQVPDVVRFFVANAASVRTASFQLQADTGRGVQGERGPRITHENLARQIELGAGTSASTRP